MKNSTKIILLTCRSDIQARTNILTAIEATNGHENVRLYIAYGGTDELHINWLNCTLPKTNKVQLLIEESMQHRFLWALQHHSEWLIFISDDDAITTNYFTALMNEIDRSDSSIANIFPKYYALHNGNTTDIINLPNIDQDDPFLRLKQYATQTNQGVRYYSAHRSGKIESLVKERMKNNFFPSYTDQLIVASSLIAGKSISNTELNIFVYDYGNWKDLESSILSDAKHYKEKSMILFHEIYWIIDYMTIFNTLLDRADFRTWFKSFSMQRIEHSLLIFKTRQNVISISDEESQFFFKKIKSKYNAIKNSSSKEDLFNAIAV